MPDNTNIEFELNGIVPNPSFVTGRVPVTYNFDLEKVIGVADIHEDGTATIELSNDYRQMLSQYFGDGKITSFSIGFGFMAIKGFEPSTQAKLF